MMKRMIAKPAVKHRFSHSIGKYVAGMFLAISVLGSAPHSALADKPKIDDDAHYDGRVQNYDPDVELSSSSSGMTWFLVLILGFVCIFPIFKDAKRSHLD